MSTDLSKTSPMDRLREQPGKLAEMSWEELEAQAKDLEMAILDATDVGDGFFLIDSAKGKEYLVGVPLLVLDWTIYPSKTIPGSYFTSAIIKTKDPVAQFGGRQNFRLNDGSTGIHRQLKDLKDGGFTGVVACRRGLRVSKDYVVTEPLFDEKGRPVLDEMTGRQQTKPKVDPMTGNEIHGTTYYLDTSA